MVSSTPVTSSAPARRRAPVSRAPEPESRFDRRLNKILLHATEVFYEKGYAGASMRDLSRASGMSLSGLYYYFESKEKLLYLIQKETFTTIVERLRERLEAVSDPEQRIRIFILNHLEYFLANRKAMKVLSHEDDVLKNGFGAEVAAIKREYYRICVGLLDDFRRERKLEGSSRLAVLSTVWHDELDLHLVQPAGGRRRGRDRRQDGRHFSSRRGCSRPAQEESQEEIGKLNLNSMDRKKEF